MYINFERLSRELKTKYGTTPVPYSKLRAHRTTGVFSVKDGKIRFYDGWKKQRRVVRELPYIMNEQPRKWLKVKKGWFESLW